MRRLRAYSVGAIGLVGIAFACFMFSEALQPSARAKVERSVHDISTLQAGTFRIDPFGRVSAWNFKVLLMKDWGGELHAYLLPTDKGKVPLPERWWGHGYYHCSDFSPETDAEGRLIKGGVIKCHDQETPSWGVNVWRWKYDGSPAGEWGVEMYRPPLELVGDTLYLNI